MALTPSNRPPHDDALCGTREYGDCFKCVIQGVRLGKPSDFPTRTYSKTPPRGSSNSYEAGIPVSHRPDGSVMPYLRSDGEIMGQKEYDSKRRVIEENRKRLANASSSPQN